MRPLRAVLRFLAVLAFPEYGRKPVGIGGFVGGPARSSRRARPPFGVPASASHPASGDSESGGSES